MLGNRYMYPLMLRKAEIFTGLVEAVQCSCTSMAQCMRHAPLDIFTPSCLDMHGEYILTQWATIRFFISLAILSNWHTRQLDFVFAYTQADIERDLYMKLPAGFTLPNKTITEQDRKDYILKLEKNLYGQKQAGRVWYLHLKRTY